jgi:3-methyladenine DNA glycosylase AlkC
MKIINAKKRTQKVETWIIKQMFRHIKTRSNDLNEFARQLEDQLDDLVADITSNERRVMRTEAVEAINSIPE